MSNALPLAQLDSIKMRVSTIVMVWKLLEEMRKSWKFQPREYSWNPTSDNLEAYKNKIVRLEYENNIVQQK